MGTPKGIGDQPRQRALPDTQRHAARFNAILADVCQRYFGGINGMAFHKLPRLSEGGSSLMDVSAF